MGPFDRGTGSAFQLVASLEEDYPSRSLDPLSLLELKLNVVTNLDTDPWADPEPESVAN